MLDKVTKRNYYVTISNDKEIESEVNRYVVKRKKGFGEVGQNIEPARQHTADACAEQREHASDVSENGREQRGDEAQAGAGAAVRRVRNIV